MRITLSSLCLILLFFLSAPAWGLETIKVGTITSEPTEELQHYTPFVNYLARQMKKEGVLQGKVVLADSITQMADYLKQGKVDLYIDSPFPSIAVRTLADSKLLLRRWKKGVGQYNSVIFVKQNSKIRTLDQLRGKIIAFEEPFSSSGYLLPKMVLLESGLALLSREKPSARNDQTLSYQFSWGDESTIFWVNRDRVSAGAMSQQSFLREKRHYPLRILHKTFSIPRHLLSYRADLDPHLVRVIKKILLTMDQSPAGRQALLLFEKTRKFDEIPKASITLLLQAEKFIQKELRN